MTSPGTLGSHSVGGRRARRALLVAIGAGLMLVAPFASGTALAHANLTSSDPSNGAVLEQPPNSVVMRFTEAPEVKLALVRVLDASGNQFQTGPARSVPGDATALRVGLKELPDGVYTVAWRVVSRTDGHATAGALAFGVGVAPADVKPSTAAIPKQPPPSVGEMASRWLFLWGLVALVGATWMALVAFGESPPAGVRRMAWIALVGAAVGLGGLALAQRAESGAGLGSFFGTKVGRAILLRAVALAAAATALFWAGRAGPGRRRMGLGLAGAGAAAAALAEVAAGHAAASSLPLAEVAAQWAHVVAVALWIGGLVAVLVGIRGESSETKARAARRFSAVALFAVIAVAATGVLRALDEVGSWKALFHTSYGWWVVVKIGLLLGLIALGAVNRYRSIPAAHRSLRGLRRVGSAEIALAAAALVATAALAGLSPPRGQVAAAQPTAALGVVVSGSDFGTTTRVRLQVSPGTAGPNTFTATITDYDTGGPVRANRVQLRFSPLDQSGVGTSTLDLRPAGRPGSYRGSGPNLSLDGRWTVDLLVQSAANSVDVPMLVATRCEVQALVAPGQPTIYTAQLPGGATVQGYLDPGTTGLNEIHFTFFDAQGTELPIGKLPMVTAATGTSPAIDTEVRRFSAGHFISDQTLTAGRWRFQIVVPATSDGTTYRACFEQVVRPS